MSKLFPVLDENNRSKLITYIVVFGLFGVVSFGLPMYYLIKYNFFSSINNFKIFYYFPGAGAIALGLFVFAILSFINVYFAIKKLISKK